MRCPRCGYNGALVDGGCARCGYGRTRSSSRPQPSYALPTTSTYTFSRGDMVNRGRYRLLEQLALPETQRGQGRAWFASDMQSPQRRVILRELPPREGYQQHEEERIRSAAMQLNEFARYERGIPQVLDIFREQGLTCIVVEHIEGNSLASLIQQQGGALPERIVAEYGRQLCRLLSALSSQRPPIVHGGISPSTIVISPDGGSASLIHFPILAPVMTAAPAPNAPTGYLAPEQVRGEAEPSSDLYSLAATLHYAVTGYDPSERMSFFHPPARRLNPAVTPQMEAILARELRLSVAQRYPDAAAMQRDLELLVASYPNDERLLYPGQGIGDPQPRPALKPRDSSTLLDIGVFAAITVLLLIGLLFFLLR